MSLMPTHRQLYGVIGAIFALVIVLEYSTPPAYVFGYLYIGAVLIASIRLSRQATVGVIAIAVLCTLLNLVVPGGKAVAPVTLANRLITVFALIVTGWLGYRIQAYEQAITRQQIQLMAQKQMARIREDFVSTLTHDLKTPLLGALETLHALHSGKFGAVTPAQRQVFAVMTRSHDKTLQLVETLMDIYRNDAEGLILHCQPLDLLTLAEEAMASITSLAESRQIYLRLRDETSDFRRTYWVNGDALQLSRVFVNLMVNAINHSRRGSSVQIVLGASSNACQVQIMDEGQGIAAEELPHLFKRFYQGHSESGHSEHQTRGAGLGLYLSRQIIEAHGGKIWAEPRAQGAVFAFRLPSCVHELHSPTQSHPVV